MTTIFCFLCFVLMFHWFTKYFYLASDKTQELLDYLEAEVDAKGLDALMPEAFIANYARPRRFEVSYILRYFVLRVTCRSFGGQISLPFCSCIKKSTGEKKLPLMQKINT